MPEIFDTLPGQEVPVGGIAAGFSKLWEDSPTQEARAVQLNLVLHFGSQTTAADAEKQFRNTLQFAHRYPCRVVVLCPDFNEKAPPEIRAKIYGECFFGKSKSDTRCVEFVILHYTVAARGNLENQVSVCLSTDMPLYYWAHRFSAAKRLADYGYLLTRSKRVLFDSALEPEDTFTFPWPNISAVRDLAYTRTLPLRQNLGQFLSRYAPGQLVDGLQGVTVHFRADAKHEAAAILNWIKKGLVRCHVKLDALKFETTAADGPASLAVSFNYAGGKKTFRWTADLAKDEANFEGDLGAGRTTLTVAAHFLTPEATLAEAMFF